jgi:hypothetical protein
MARDQALVICQPGVWTELTNGDVTEITFQVVTGSVKIRCTTGSAPSSLSDPGYVYHARPADDQEESGELRIELSQLAAGADIDRVFATPISGRVAKVVVDHA